MRLIIILLFFYSSLCMATVYMEKNDRGGISFSDIPLSNSKPIEVKPINTISTPPPRQELETSPPATQVVVKTNYQSISFITPKNEETLNNQPVIPVELKVEPELAKEDRIQLYLNDQAYSTPLNATQFQIHQLERGTHRLKAKIIDKNNSILKESPTITIYVHRTSAILQKAP